MLDEAISGSIIYIQLASNTRNSGNSGSNSLAAIMFSSFKTSSVDSNKALAKRLCRVGPARVPIPGPLDIAVEGSLAENRSSSTPLSAGRRSSLLLTVGTSWCSFRARIEKHPTNVCRTTRRGHQKERPRKTVHRSQVKCALVMSFLSVRALRALRTWRAEQAG